MRIAMLAPISWRTPPRHYGPWEQVTSLLTEALVARATVALALSCPDSPVCALPPPPARGWASTMRAVLSLAPRGIDVTLLPVWGVQCNIAPFEAWDWRTSCCWRGPWGYWVDRGGVAVDAGLGADDVTDLDYCGA